MGSTICTYESQILPLPLFGESEMQWPNSVRFILYVLGLGWTFLGIAIISDIFMAGIEKVTSLKKRVKDKDTGRTVTVHVWNATVANLTLMALGSSAPEILLSVIEIASNEMYLGDLGTGTIVGSAAFNLLVISAVCVLAIPDGEVRFIKEVPVYVITASCSILAYLWLMVVLMAPPSPNVVEVWEAVLTLFFFPIMVFAAYAADIGYCSFGMPQSREPTSVIPENVTKDELVQIEQQIRQKHGSNLSPEQVVSIMTNSYFTQRSRAYYRHAAMQQTLGMKKVITAVPSTDDYTVTPALDTHDNLENEREKVSMGFDCPRYAFLENCEMANVVLSRKGPTDVRAWVKYKTRDGSAMAGSDYEVAGGTLVFEKEETQKTLGFKIFDDNAYEENEEFYVDLYDPECDENDPLDEMAMSFASKAASGVECFVNRPKSGTWEPAQYSLSKRYKNGFKEFIIRQSGCTDQVFQISDMTKITRVTNPPEVVSKYSWDSNTQTLDEATQRKIVIMTLSDGEEIWLYERDKSIPDAELFQSSMNALAKYARGSKEAVLAEFDTVTVVIIDDDEPGCLRFVQEEVHVIEGTVEKKVTIKVERFQGASGTISCQYRTEGMAAVAGVDYVETHGKIELGPAVQSASIPITICPKGRYDKSSGFNVILSDAVGCKFDKETDGAEESCICHVIITGDQTPSRMTLIQRMESRINMQKTTLGHAHWRDQFYNALFVVGGDEDDDEEEGDEEGGGPSKFDFFMHIVSVPWKLLFACVPPVDFCGGWACFFCALIMIGCTTALVGDLARLVGCVMNINPEITAITFVALGTSLPDTFASKTAAMMDPHADASIGNITGSNSVNVFLGLGLSWTIASFYWETADFSQKWHDEVFRPGGLYYEIRDDVKAIMRDGQHSVFVVPSGSLWFNLLVFSGNAFCAVSHLSMRRYKWGGELGGPKKGFMGQYFSAVFLVFQWFIYITASSIFATAKGSD
jgi:solute carrier family 8 (sodium/calcium exchanger)